MFLGICLRLGKLTGISGPPVGGGTPTVVSVSSPSVVEGGNLVYTVTLSGATTEITNYSFSFYGGSVGTADFTDFNNPALSNGVTKSAGSSGTLTVPSGVSSFTFTWVTVNDALYEYDPETLNLDVAGVISTGYLYDNDTPPVVSFTSDQTTLEGGTMTFSVSISATPGRPVTVDYATSDNTALAGLDYTATSGTLTWATADSANKTFTVAITADSVTPETESFFVTLSNPVACTIGTGSAVGNITDVPDSIFGTATNGFLLADAGNGVVNITDSIGSATPVFTRSTAAATRLSSGVWKLDVAVNQPRSYYDINGAYLGFLNEPAATQLITAGDVRDMTGVNWAKTLVTAVKNATGIDGVANSANTLTATGANGTILFTLTAAASSRTYSAFVRRKTGTGTIILKHAAATLDITSLINSTTWVQVSLNANTINASMGFQINTSGDEIEVDCNQFEAGTLATSPIPAAGTRGADKLNTVVAITTGSLFASWIPFDTTKGDILGSSHSAATTHFMRQATSTTLTCYDGTATRTPQTVAARTAGNRYKAAFGFDGTTLSSAENGVNGAGSAFDGTFNGYTLVIGNRTNTSDNIMHGCIQSAYIWQTTRLTDLELATITGVPAAPTISSVTATNANEGSNVTFAVTISNPYISAQSFTYTLSGTAVAGTDYTNSPTLTNGCTIGGGNITFPSGVTSTVVTYPTIDNGTVTGHRTLIATASAISDTATIYDTDAIGDSLSTYAVTNDVLDVTATTDTLNVNDFTANGELFSVPPASGTGVKTVHKTGSGNSKVFSRSRLGYVRLDNTSPAESIKIGNANLTLTKSHAFGVLCRMPLANITGYNGEYIFAKTSQNGLSGNPYFSLGVGGASDTDAALRKYVFAKREGYAASVSATQKEISNLYSGVYGSFCDAYGAQGVASADNVWIWLWVGGTLATDPVLPLNFSHDGTGTHGQNSLAIIYALHGCEPNSASINCRWQYSPQWTTGVDNGMNPEVLNNIDFVLASGTTGTGKSVDIARVVKLSTFNYDLIAEISSGMHPESMGIMTGDDFCLDFGSLPSICTETNSPTYNPAADGPIAQCYHGTDATDVVLNISNQRIT